MEEQKKSIKYKVLSIFISCALMTFMLDYMKNELTEYELQPFDRKCTASNLFPQTVGHLAVGTYLDKRHNKTLKHFCMKFGHIQILTIPYYRMTF